jgi:hypothetical protein
MFMNRRIFQLAILLLWLTLPLVGFEYWHAWDQLPANVATHFNAAGQANGWMTRGDALEFGLGIMAVLLVVVTPLLWYKSRRETGVLPWAIFVVCAVVLGFMVAGNQVILNYNLHGTSVTPGAMLLVFPVAIVAFIAIYMGSHRDTALPVSEVLAAESHTGRIWCVLFVPAIVGPLVIAATVPSPALRFSIAIVALVVFAAGAMAWSGFQYRFLRHGVEIRTLGYRLRSIPRQQILSYGVEPWGWLRGYGIRGIGNCRAYVWGNKVVHIKTSNGDVFLGHSDPERIVSDLNRVMSHQV